MDRSKIGLLCCIAFTLGAAGVRLFFRFSIPPENKSTLLVHCVMVCSVVDGDVLSNSENGRRYRLSGTRRVISLTRVTFPIIYQRSNAIIIFVSSVT